MSNQSREAYDSWHSKYEVDDELGSAWHRMVVQHLNMLQDLDGKKLLEVGCGRGEFACWLAALKTPPTRIVAVDVSPVAVAKGRAHAMRQGLNGIEWEVGDIQNLAHPSGSFDTVVSCETVEHVLDPGGAVAELSRVLRVGGRLFLTTPNYLSTMGLYRLYARLTGRRYTEIGQPINRLTMWPRTLAWVSRAGLRICLLEGVGHYLPVHGRPPIRFMALDKVRFFTRWTALHSLILAEKV